MTASQLSRTTRLGEELAAIRRGLLDDTEHGWTPGEIREVVGEMTITPPQPLVETLETYDIVIRVNLNGVFYLGFNGDFRPFPDNTIGNNAERTIFVLNVIRSVNNAAIAILPELEGLLW